jgi:hypothetical protein
MIAKFSTAEDLMAHYATVRARLHGPAPKVIIHASALPQKHVEPEPLSLPEEVKECVTTMTCMEPHQVRINFEDVVTLVCNDLGYTRREIFAERKTMKLCFDRQLLWALACNHCLHMSLPKIGRASGGRDHTTVLHGKRMGVSHPAYERLNEMLNHLYDEKMKFNDELIAKAEMEKEGV